MSWFALIPAAISAVGAVKQGQDAQDAANYNASVAEQTSQEQARRDAIQARMVIGQDRANYGASGVTTEGSPLDVLQQSAKMAELDKLTTIYAGATQAASYRAQGKAARTASYFQAAGSLAEGYAKYKSLSPSSSSSSASTSLLGSGSYQDAGTTLSRVG